MADTPTDKQFWDIADAIIHLANAESKTAGRAKVSAALLFAAARFNAFVSAADLPDEAALRASREEALEYFTTQYAKMLGDNLDDWATNFAKYTGRGKGAGA